MAREGAHAKEDACHGASGSAEVSHFSNRCWHQAWQCSSHVRNVAPRPLRWSGATGFVEIG
jgi:hypothetical protein